MAVELHGYQYSVYTRIARIALAEKNVNYTRIEVDPFQKSVPEQYRAMHPFLRVPTLIHDDFILYETSAITRYVDDSFSGPLLQPDNSRERARMAQIISVIDNYGYLADGTPGSLTSGFQPSYRRTYGRERSTERTESIRTRARCH